MTRAVAAALLFSGVVVLAAGSAAAAPSTGQPRVRAAGGQAILAASERAAAVVAGTVSNRRQIDAQAWTATLAIADAISGALTAGSTTRIAWEELSPSREVRFDDGERILVVLDRIPDQTIWARRFASPEDRADYIVAERGDAFVRSPDPASLNSLLHYFAMAAVARGGAPGALRLVELAAEGNATLGGEALELLKRRKDLASELGEEGAAILLGVAGDEQREATVRVAALQLAAACGLPKAKEAAVALAQPGSALRAEALRVLATLPSGLTPAQKLALLDDQDAAVRVVGIEVSGATAEARARLIELAKKDPSPPARLAAGSALLESQKAAAIADVLPLLDDPDARVRAGIAARIGELGAPAIDALENVVDTGSEQAALAAVLGLASAGSDGSMSLLVRSRSHPNKKVQTLATLALGKAPDADKH